MENQVGILKDVDRLGRLVIPKELRDLYHLGDRVEVVATEGGVLVRDPQYILVKKEKA